MYKFQNKSTLAFWIVINKYYKPTFIYIMQEIFKVANISQCDAVYQCLLWSSLSINVI